MVEVQRDVLKSRRGIIKKDDQLFRSRADELADVRRQLDVIDTRWARTRWRDEIDINTRPMVTGVEWSALVARDKNLDWGQWGALDPNEQWGEMAKADLIFEKPLGIVDDGNNSDRGERGREVVRRVTNSLTMPPSTFSAGHPRIIRPLEAMPHGYGPARNTGNEGGTQRFPERPPVSAKPPPTDAPPAQRRSQENLSAQERGGMSGVRENQSRSSAERDANEEYRRINIEGTQFLGFG